MRRTFSLLFTKQQDYFHKRLALPTSDHGIAGSNPAGGEILPEPKRRFIAQSPSISPFHRLEMTEILLKGRKTLTHPSIFPQGWQEKNQGLDFKILLDKIGEKIY